MPFAGPGRPVEGSPPPPESVADPAAHPGAEDLPSPHPAGPSETLSTGPFDEAPRLRRLQWMGIALPIGFLVAIESFRYIAIAADPTTRAEHVAIAVIVGIGVVAFAVFMFSMIERVERRIVRRNRELAAINAVSTAVQGELGVPHIIDAALQAVIERTNATEASVTVFPQREGLDAGLERRVVAGRHASPSALGRDMPHLIDIPLTVGTSVVGRMRLHLPEGVAEPDLLASATLQNIGHQLATSIQIGQLVADLQRRKREGHGLYDVLLRISNQRPLAETLAAITGHARDLVHVDAAAILLAPANASVLYLDEPGDAVTSPEDGTVCVGATGDLPQLLHHGLVGPVAPTEGAQPAVRVPLGSPEGSVGELLAIRRSGPAFDGRERGYLAALAELGSIAVMNARMRESERQAAILAERDRIAREMHDSLAQVLGSTHLRLRALRPKIAPFEAPAIEADLAELADVTEEAYRDVREAILGLRESSRADRALLEGLRAFLEKYSRQAGIRATLVTSIEGEPDLSPRAEVQVIRVIQEALANVRKHARASSATVTVVQDADAVTIRVEDDGRGFDPTSTLLDRDSGFGLHTMRERMEAVEGSLEIESAPGAGTRVVARVPTTTSRIRPAEVNGADEGSGRYGRQLVGSDSRPARR